MAKSELIIEQADETPVTSAFIRCFQEQTLRLLRQRGLLSETQFLEGLRRLAGTRL